MLESGLCTFIKELARIYSAKTSFRFACFKFVCVCEQEVFNVKILWRAGSTVVVLAPDLKMH